MKPLVKYRFSDPSIYQHVERPDIKHVDVYLASDVDPRLAALETQLNTPEILDFCKAVNLEAAHQRERWGTDHDGGKTDADWFWLVGYLTGKALHLPEKRLHHLITAAAALANWHLYSVGKTDMRPGIEPPDAALAATQEVS